MGAFLSLLILMVGMLIFSGNALTVSAEKSAKTETFVENPDFVVLAYSKNYPDGLCGGPGLISDSAAMTIFNMETGEKIE